MPFTPTQQRILEMLSDGLYHRQDQLLRCLNDDMTDKSTLNVHLSNLRKILASTGERIICMEEDRITYYRHVRVMSPSSSES